MNEVATKGSAWDRSLGIAEQVLRIITAVLFAGMVVVVFINVFARYFLSTSIPWSEEVSRFFLIYTVFLGAIVAYINNEHLGLDLLTKTTPPVVSHTLTLIAHILSLVALAFLGFGGFQIAGNSLASGWTAPASGIPYGVIYAVVPVSTAVLCVQAIVKIIKTIVGYKSLFSKER